MKSSGSFSAKTSRDPLGAATLASFFEKAGQKIQKSKGVEYKAKIVERKEEGEDISKDTAESVQGSDNENRDDSEKVKPKISFSGGKN
jgi:hypothetical protein